MTNILEAIKVIINNSIPDIVNYYQNKNQINSVGDALECFIKNIFSGALHEDDLNKKNKSILKTFSI